VRTGRVAAGLDKVPDREPAVGAPPGDREFGRLKAADRDADDPLARVDAGVAFGQQGYRRAGGHDLEFLVGRAHLSGNPRRPARSRFHGQPEIALGACRRGQRGNGLVDDLGELNGLAVRERVARADRYKERFGGDYYCLNLGGINGQPYECRIGCVLP